METQSKKNDLTFNGRAIASMTNGIDYVLKSFSREMNEFKHFFQQNSQFSPDDFFKKLAAPPGKKSFLVLKHNKYIIVPTENIALFYVKYEASTIMCFDRQEYSVNYSLEHIQNLLPGNQFFRLNRQYLINFYAIKEVEHYFERKLLVKLPVPVPDKLLVSKEKASSFLHWLEDR